MLKPGGRFHTYDSAVKVILEGISYFKPVAKGPGQIEIGPVGFDAALLPLPVVGAEVYLVATTAVLDPVVHPPKVALT